MGDSNYDKKNFNTWSASTNEQSKGYAFIERLERLSTLPKSSETNTRTNKSRST